MSPHRNPTPSWQVGFGEFIFQAKDHHFLPELLRVDGQVSNNLENAGGLP
jgi:hypothetical protein